MVMKKKILGIFVCLLLLFTFFVVTPETVFADKDGDYFYIVSDGVATITGYIGAGGAITIPSTLGGYPTVHIGNQAFNNDSGHLITSVIIPNSVTTIGNYAFAYCTSLTSVTLPNSITTTGDYTFYYCISLNSVSIGTGVTIIGEQAFYNCINLNSITIHNGVTTIMGSAFAYCSSLTSVTIPDSVTTIKEGVFYHCTSLTSMTITNSVTTIGDAAFGFLTSLTAINVDATNVNYASIDGVLYNKDITTLIQCPSGKAGTFTILSSVTTIGGFAFVGCTYLTSVTIPLSVTTIGKHAFQDCPSLTSIIIPDSVTSVGVAAFEYDVALTSVSIGNSVISFGQWAFYCCTSLTSITIPSSVTTIGGCMFWSCYSLTSITFLGLVAPTTVGGDWLHGTPVEIRGHAYSNSNFPPPGEYWNNLMMGAYINQPDIVYVDDDFDSSTPGWGYDHFSSIQAGIDAVDVSGTVFVYSGTYYENVIIGRTINLIGEDRNNTIIDGGGSGDVVYVYADWVNISGFTIKNCGDIVNAGIEIHSDYNTITANRIVSNINYYGIEIYDHSNSNIISDNIITGNNAGISIWWYSCNNIVADNYISSNINTGVYVYYSSNNNLIINNIIMNNNVGIDVRYSCNESTISGNNISGNSRGVYLLFSSFYNNISDNVISLNDFGGISILQSADDNLIYHNNIFNNVPNANDECVNMWDNGYPSGGNYWSDYTGVDNNHDGIGDTPYNIAGGSNQDLYPFMNPNGWLNNPPFTPHDPMPIDYATNISLNTLLQWMGGDPDVDDNVTYDVYLGSTLPLPKVSANQSRPWYKSQTPSYNTTYYWKIVAWDNHGLSTAGPIWRFTTTSKAGNHPPNVPSNPSPPNQATSVDIDAALSWTGGDPDAGDFVFYDVYFGSMPPLEKIASNITAKSYNPGPLAYSLTYFWKVVAWDIHGLSTVGPVWYFTTMNATNNPPNKPSKPSGPINGKKGQNYSYTTATTDPDGDQVYYLWDWGDGNNSGWLGPYNSGATINTIHKWTVKGSYSIKVKAKDIHGKESSWSDPLPITMPYTYKPPLIQFLDWLFQRFPHAFPILRHLLGY